MKRSEMVRLIDQCLYDYTDDDFMVLKPSEFVYELLKRIEEAGMLPPVIERDLGILDAKGNPSTEMISEWEPEDE